MNFTQLFLRTCVFFLSFFFFFHIAFQYFFFCVNCILTNSLLLVIYFLFFLFRSYIFSYYCYFKSHIAPFPGLTPFCLLPDFSYCCSKLYFHATPCYYSLLLLLLFHPSLQKHSSFLKSAHILFPPLIVVLFPFHLYKLWVVG